MDADLDDPPEDVAALRQALKMALAQASIAEQKSLDAAAELAVAKAMASEDKAMIAHQALRIAKLERQIYGPRKERSAQLQDQMELALEEQEASATEDEIAAEIAVAKTTTVAGFVRKRPQPRTTFPDQLFQRARGDQSANGVRVLRWEPASQARRGCGPHLGINPPAVEGDRDRPGELHVSRLRESQPGAGSFPRHPPRMGGPKPSGDDPL